MPEYADLVGAEGERERERERKKKEPPSSREEEKRRRLIRQDDWTANVFGFAISPLSALDCYTDKCMACRRPV